jgi:hypothetical protein
MPPKRKYPVTEAELAFDEFCKKRGVERAPLGGFSFAAFLDDNGEDAVVKLANDALKLVGAQVTVESIVKTNKVFGETTVRITCESNASHEVLFRSILKVAKGLQEVLFFNFNTFISLTIVCSQERWLCSCAMQAKAAAAAELKAAAVGTLLASTAARCATKEQERLDELVAATPDAQSFLNEHKHKIEIHDGGRDEHRQPLLSVATTCTETQTTITKVVPAKDCTVSLCFVFPLSFPCSVSCTLSFRCVQVQVGQIVSAVRSAHRRRTAAVTSGACKGCDPGAAHAGVQSRRVGAS